MKTINDVVHAGFVFRGKQEAKRLIRKEGFALIGKDSKPLSKKQVEDAFSLLTDVDNAKIQKFVVATVGDVIVPVTGRIADWWAAIKLWLSDPANREKLMAIIKFIMTILAALLML